MQVRGFLGGGEESFIMRKFFWLTGIRPSYWLSLRIFYTYIYSYVDWCVYLHTKSPSCVKMTGRIYSGRLNGAFRFTSPGWVEEWMEQSNTSNLIA